MYVCKKDIAELRAVEDGFDREYAPMASAIPIVEHNGCSGFHWRVARAFAGTFAEGRRRYCAEYKSWSTTGDVIWIGSVCMVLGVCYLALLAFAWRNYDFDASFKYGLGALILTFVVALASCGLRGVRRQQRLLIQRLQDLYSCSMALASAMIVGDRPRIERALIELGTGMPLDRSAPSEMGRVPDPRSP